MRWGGRPGLFRDSVPPDSTSWTPLYSGWGPRAHDPRPRAASVPPILRVAAPLYLRVGALRGAQPHALPLFLFIFLPFGRENGSVRFRPIYVSTREQTLVACCVCVSLCWFFKETGRRKKKSSPLIPRALSSSSRHHPLSFCLVLFCYESTFLFRNPWFAGFVFSVKSSLRQLGCPPPSSPARAEGGRVWPAPIPLPPPLTPPLPAARRERGVGAGPVCTSAAQRAPPRCMQSAQVQVAPGLKACAT